MSIEYRVVSIEYWEKGSEALNPLLRGETRNARSEASWHEQGLCSFMAIAINRAQSKLNTRPTHPCQFRWVLNCLSPLKRGFVFTLFFILALTNPLIAQETGSKDRPQELQILESYFEMAVERNPELASLRYKIEAQKARSPQVRALADPEIGIGYYINPVMETAFTGRFSVSAMQMFPWFGTLNTREQVEETIAETMYHAANARQLEIFTNIQNLWFEYYQMDHHLHITMEIVRLVRDLESLIEARYETGRAGQVDLLRIQMEEQRLLNRIEELEDEKNPIREALNALMNRDPDEAVLVPAELPERSLAWTKEELFRLARSHHPDFSRIDSQRDQYNKEMELARLEGRPSFGIGLEYMASDFGMMSMMDLENVLTGMATVRIPLYKGRYRAQRNEARLQLRAADNLEADLTNRLHSDIERAMKSLRDAQRDYQLIVGELLPRSRQTVEILSEEYAGGQVRFDELLQVLRELLMLEMERVNALVAQNKTMAAIEQQIAIDWTIYE